jgi:putative sterol carrier protein
MAFYKSSEEFYAVIQKGFEELAKDPKATEDFHKRHMVVDIRCKDPDVEVMLDGRSNPIKTSFGPYAGKSDLKLELPTDLFHQILMGTASVKAAFMGGSVKVTGNMFRALQLKDLFYQISRLYPTVLKDMGYDV